MTADKENGTENNELSNEIDMVESAILDDIVKPVKTKKAKKKRTDSENANNTTKKVKKSKKNKESMNDWRFIDLPLFLNIKVPFSKYSFGAAVDFQGEWFDAFNLLN